jgi:2-dehydropantoate 2-reductase
VTARLARAGERVCLLLRDSGKTNVAVQRRLGKAAAASSAAVPSAVIRVQDERHIAKLKLDAHPGELNSPTGTTNFSVELPTGKPQDDSPIERVLVAVKAYDAVAAVRQLRHRLGPSSVVVLLCQQPAILDELAAEKEFAGLTFLLATTTHGCYNTQRFHIIHSCGEVADDDSTWFGLPSDRQDSLSRPEMQVCIAAGITM